MSDQILVSNDNIEAILKPIVQDMYSKIATVGLTDADRANLLKISEIDTLQSEIAKLQTDLDTANTVNFMNANDAKIKILNVIGDASLANTSTFTQISNALISKKQAIVDALASKGIIATKADDIGLYASYINSISQNSTVKNTKLNKTVGSTYQVILTNPGNLTDICTTVLEYIPGPTGVVQYDCNFNNSDSTAFAITTDQHISLTGVMSQDNNIQTISTTNEGTVGIYNVYSATINRSSFHTLESISSAISSVIVSGTYFPTLVQANSDIGLLNVDAITNITWTATVNNTSVLLLIYSTDSGITWNGYDTVNHVVVPISDISNLSEVKSKGIIISNVNNLSTSDLAIIRNNSPKIRFAYYFEKNAMVDTIQNDEIKLTVNMTGNNILSTDYSLSFDGNKTLTYTFTKNATYTITYVDNN